MSFTDPIGDMLTRVRNGHKARKSSVVTPASNLRMNVLEVLKQEGYIRAYQKREVRKGISEIVIELKYHENEPVISRIERVSKPGRRVYRGINDLMPVANGLGISVLSTPKGVLSDGQARELNVGGEVLCNVF